MKKKSMFSLISLCLVLGLLSACGSGKSSGADQTTAETTSQSTTESASTTTDSSTSLDLSDMQQIGEAGYGYVYVPSDWIKFHDIATGGASYQYADPSTYNVVTLFSYTAEDLGVEKLDDQATEQAAISYGHQLNQQDTYENLIFAVVEIAGYEAYQVNATLKSDGKIICAWFFRTEKNDKVYLVSLEGDKETFAKVQPAIEKSWTETK
jgi:hypothetical protein